MIYKMFTINGKASTIGNVALTGSAIADPSVILHYSGTPSVNRTLGTYDGFSIRIPKSGTSAYDYFNLCYYSTAYYEQPNLNDLTKALFLSRSADLNTESDYLVSNQEIDGKYRKFPVDFYSTAVDVPGAYYLPHSAFEGGNELYVYLWLPDVQTAPDDNDQVGLDCTLLETYHNWNMDILKAKLPAMTFASFNQTCVKSITNADIAYDSQVFGYGGVINSSYYGLGDINLVSDSKIGCTNNTGLQEVYSAYNSELSGFNISHAENCKIFGDLENINKPVTALSAINCDIPDSVSYKSANTCNITGYPENSTAINSNVILRGFTDTHITYKNCNISGSIYSDLYLSAEDSNITSTYLNPGYSPVRGNYKNCYFYYVNTGNPAFNSSWYAEDYPTTPFVPL